MRSIKLKQLALTIFILFLIGLGVWKLNQPYRANTEEPAINAAELDTKIKLLWQRQIPTYRQYLVQRLQADDLEVLYTLELLLHNLVEYSRQTGDVATIREIIAVNEPAFDSLKTIDGHPQWICGSPCAPIRLEGQEYILASSQYLYLQASLLNGLAALSENELTLADKQYMEKITPILRDHYERWIYGPSIYTSWWSDCAPNERFNYIQTLEWKLAPPQTGYIYEYCKVTHDVEMLMAGGVIELLGANKQHPNIVKIDPSSATKLRQYPVRFADLLKARLKVTNLTDVNGAAKEGLVLDPGLFRQHHDWQFAGYTGATYPTAENKKIVDTVSWDVSHYRRLIHLFGSYRRHQNLLGVNFPTDKDLERQINQFAYAVFNGDKNLPLFKTFTDGSNGWYRVNYEGQVGVATKPFSQSIDVAVGGYGFWAAYHKDWYSIMAALYRYISNPDSPQLAKHYWVTDDRGSRDWENIYFLPSLLPLTKPPVNIINPSPSLTPSPTPNTSPTPAITVTPSTGGPKNDPPSPAMQPTMQPTPSPSPTPQIVANIPTNSPASMAASAATNSPAPQIPNMGGVADGDPGADVAGGTGSAGGTGQTSKTGDTTPSPTSQNAQNAKPTAVPTPARSSNVTISPSAANTAATTQIGQPTQDELTGSRNNPVDTGAAANNDISATKKEASEIGFLKMVLIGGQIVYTILFSWLLY